QLVAELDGLFLCRLRGLTLLFRHSLPLGPWLARSSMIVCTTRHAHLARSPFVSDARFVRDRSPRAAAINADTQGTHAQARATPREDRVGPAYHAGRVTRIARTLRRVRVHRSMHARARRARGDVDVRRWGQRQND